MHAAWKGHLPVVEYLVEKGADMEAKNEVSHGCKAIHTSYMNIHVCE